MSTSDQVTYPDEIPLVIPSPLLTLLENDCIEITQRKKLVELPAAVSVEALLTSYYSFVYSQNSSSTPDEQINLPLLIEVLDGIKVYFDFTLGDHLLYQEERDQYECLITVAPGTSHMTTSHMMVNGIDDDDSAKTRKSTPSSQYGAMHLLRLFVKFPLFLSRAKLPVNHVHLLHHYFKGLLIYFSANLDIFSIDKYIPQQ